MIEDALLDAVSRGLKHGRIDAAEKRSTDDEALQFVVTFADNLGGGVAIETEAMGAAEAVLYALAHMRAHYIESLAATPAGLTITAVVVSA